MDGDKDEMLFVCGGWWNGYNLSLFYKYDIANTQWIKLSDMKYGHQCGGICEWKEKGNKIIVAAGYQFKNNTVEPAGYQSVNNKVEQYDIHKNKWFDLPYLKTKHESYPLLMTSNNILFCIGGVCQSSDNLGHIEMYDDRDRVKKWFYIDSVEKYFNLPNDKGAGYNCFLPL